MRDFPYALRALRKSPAFAVTATVTIALGIGATTCIFSVTNAVLLRPLPYSNPERLVLATMEFPFTNAGFLELRQAAGGVFEDMSGVFTFRAIVPREDGRPERIYEAEVTANFFRMMGAKLAAGRDFSEADEQPQGIRPGAGLPPGSTVMLSYEYWQRRYGGDPAVVGQEMRSPGGRGPRIAGVLAPGFRLYYPGAAVPDVWIANNLGFDGRAFGLQAIGRLRGGIRLERAEQRVRSMARELWKSNAEEAASGSRIRLVPMRQHLVAEVRTVILALMSAVVFLLLIACANVANLLLARASGRERELAVRAALGAGRARLMRLTLAEALLLAGAGTVAGVGLARLGIRALPALAPANLPRIETIGIDLRVLAFAVAAGLSAAAVFAAAPAWRAVRPNLMQVLRGGRAAATGSPLLRNATVVVEAALSCILLAGSCLMVRSFRELSRIQPGYDPHGLLTFLLVRDWDHSAPPEKRMAYLRAVQDRLRRLPGAEGATASPFLPLTGALGRGMEWETEWPREAGEVRSANLQSVLPGYFETFRTRLLAGRTFTDRDNSPERAVAVIDELLAKKAFPNQSAVGRRIRIPAMDPRWFEVIGVVEHQRLHGLAEAGHEQIYLTDAVMGFGVGRYWFVRAADDAAKLPPAVRAALGAFDPQLLLLEVQPMDAIVQRAEAGTRFSLMLIGVFAAVAALLASVGLYGVLSAAVSRRTGEIGVRVALGATPGDIFRVVAGEGLRLSAMGIAFGLGAAFGLTRLMASMLVGVAATDGASFAGAAGLFLTIAAVATWVPARRAARLDPNAALREE